MNKLIGLVGEDPNDTRSIIHLLERKLPRSVSYTPLIRNKRGYQLDNVRTKEALKIECKRKKPHVVIFIRDADGICTQEDKIKKCKQWYDNLSNEIGARHILLLNIYELEALIFADIDTFNRHYKTTIKGGRDVTYIAEPKEELIRQTRKLNKQYAESHCPELFKSLNVENVINNCVYFKAFVNDLNELLKQ